MSFCTPDGVCTDGSAASSGASVGAGSGSAGGAGSGSGKVALKINVVSDTMCPWCYVGKAHLTEAMKRTSDKFDFEVTWLPFFLRASLPEEGMDVREYFRTQYGSDKMMDGAYARLKEAGRSVGLGFKALTGDRLLRPTVRSHALIALALEQGKQDATVDRVFKLYYEEGGALNSVDDLVRCAEDVGVVGAREYLEDKSNIDRVLYEASQYRGVTSGVPFFIVSRADAADDARRYATSGAVPPEHLVEMFESAAEAGKA